MSVEELYQDYLDGNLVIEDDDRDYMTTEQLQALQEDNPDE